MNPESAAGKRGRAWLEVRVAVSAEAAEAVAEELARRGARGLAVEEGGIDLETHAAARTLVAHYPAWPGPGASLGQATSLLLSELKDFLARLPAWGLDPGPAEVGIRLVSEDDWSEQWKAFFHPVRLGRRVVVHPSWEPPAAADLGPGDVVVAIDPGQAFGTGGHATTRGAMELLEQVLTPGSPASPEGGAGDGARDGTGDGAWVLDLGTGSGVLAVAAAKLGAARVLAIDNDPVAVAAARENVECNGVSERVEVVDGDAAALLDRFGGRPPAERPGLIVANLHTGLIVDILPAAARALPPGGLFAAAGVSSGEGEERVAAAARESGLDEMDRHPDEGWVSFLFRKPAPRAVFYTLGCKANLYDSAGMMNDLRAAGWEVRFRGGEREPGAAAGRLALEGSEDDGTERELAGGEPAVSESADLYVVNSCAVTARAEAKSRQLARKLKREHPQALVALVGCYPAVHREEAAAAAGVDLVLGTTDRDQLVQALSGLGFGPALASHGEQPTPAARGEATMAAGFSALAPPSQLIPGAFAGERTRATLKVQDGCEQFCTYCVIPYARGPSRSRPAAEVLEEAARLAETGIQEVVVTGIHLGAWGLDLGAPQARRSPPRLVDLVRQLADVPGLARIRLSSIEPMEIGDDLLEVMASNPKVCRHLHVPLQSGSDTILARMNRRYTAADYLGVVDRIRRAVPLIGLTTDVMVGFPGETDEEFAATLDTVRQARFSRLHVFRFSRRPGTPAADIPGQVAEAVKKARAQELSGLGRKLGRQFRETLVGTTLAVLVEKVAPAAGPGGADVATAEGLTDNYVRVEVPMGDPEGAVNSIVTVDIQGLTRDGLVGHRRPAQ